MFLWGSVIALLGLVLIVPFNPLLDRRRRMMEVLNNLWARGALRATPGIRVEVSGLDRLTGASEPFVIVANHSSVADIIVLLKVWPHFKFIAKGSLFVMPPIACQMHLSGYIRASAGEVGGAERVLEQACGWLKRGCHVLVFPEGTRSPDGRPMRFGQGPIVMAQRAGVRILPIAISGTFGILPKGSFRYRFRAQVRVDVLEPIDRAGDPKTIAAAARERICAALARPSPLHPRLDE